MNPKITLYSLFLPGTWLTGLFLCALLGQVHIARGQTKVWHPHMLADTLPSQMKYPHNPYINWNPGPAYADSERRFQGIPSVAVAPGGQRLWATWYGGGDGEGAENYVLLATSGDGGTTWSDVVAIVDPPYRASEPAVWVDPSGRLWWMWNQYPIRLRGPGSQLWAITTTNPDDKHPTWDAPRLITMEMNNFNKPIVLRDGRWLWPTGSWQWTAERRYTANQPLGHHSRPLFSDDDGQTFYFGGEIRTPVEKNAFDEYKIVEREDGVLWLMNRMREYGIGQCFSHDGGETWTDFEWSGIHHTTSRLVFRRLQSGNLLLVKNGPIDQDVGRSQMMAFISTDEGETWSKGLMLDERERVSYPDADQATDGTIHVIYDLNRHSDKEILLATFTEKDLVAGEPVSDRARFQILVNKATGVNPRELGDELETAPLIKGDPAELDASPYPTLDVKSGAALFSDRTYVWNEVPDVLRGRKFVQMSMDGGRVTVTGPGMLYVATPEPRRNRDNVQGQLVALGFTQASDVPEFSLFRHGTPEATLCRLYQKEVAAGDEIRIGKWGVIIF